LVFLIHTELRCTVNHTSDLHEGNSSLSDCHLFLGLRQNIGHTFKDVRKAEIATRGPMMQDT